MGQPMLTSDLVTPRVRCSATTLTVAFLNEQDTHWQKTARELIVLFAGQLGKTLTAWTQALETYIGDRLDYVVMRGLAKVLTDAATFSALAARSLRSWCGNGSSPTVLCRVPPTCFTIRRERRWYGRRPMIST